MTQREIVVALALTVAGVALIVIAMAHRWNPQDLNPGIEGCLTAGVVGFLLALLHPMPYASAAAVVSPIVAVEYAASAVAGGPAAGVVGIQLAIMGMIGLALAARSPRAAEQRDEVADESTAEARG